MKSIVVTKAEQFLGKIDQAEALWLVARLTEEARATINSAAVYQKIAEDKDAELKAATETIDRYHEVLSEVIECRTFKRLEDVRSIARRTLHYRDMEQA